MSELYAKVDASLDDHPKILAAGFWGSVVFQFLLRVNRKRRLDGIIPEKYGRADYIARQLNMHSAFDDPEPLVSSGIKSCLRAKLIGRDPGTNDLIIVGWEKEWAGAKSSTERVRMWRKKQGGETLVTSSESNTVTCNGVTPSDQISTDQIRSDPPIVPQGGLPAPKGRKRRKKAEATPAENEAIVAVIDRLSKRSRFDYSPETEEHRAYVLAQLRRGTTELELRMVVWHKANEWADDPKMREYLRPSTLFAPKKFAEYLVAARAAYEEHNGRRDTKDSLQPVRPNGREPAQGSALPDLLSRTLAEAERANDGFGVEGLGPLELAQETAVERDGGRSQVSARGGGQGAVHGPAQALEGSQGEAGEEARVHGGGGVK